jgi:hypothetical protein
MIARLANGSECHGALAAVRRTAIWNVPVCTSFFQGDRLLEKGSCFLTADALGRFQPAARLTALESIENPQQRIPSETGSVSEPIGIAA